MQDRQRASSQGALHAGDRRAAVQSAFRLFTEGLAAVGKHKRLVIGAVMRKLLVLAYGILRSGKRFDVSYAWRGVRYLSLSNAYGIGAKGF